MNRLESLCELEKLSDSTEPFLSIRDEDLVFNPTYNSWLAYILSKGNNCGSLKREQLVEFCGECGKCSPEIKVVRGSYRIRRFYYHPDTDRKDDRGYKIIPIESSENDDQSMRVVILDDYGNTAEKMAEILSNRGFRCFAIKVNRNKNVNEELQNEFEEVVLALSPDWVISDKGLGMFNSFELLKRAKEKGIKTFMITGEPGTSAIHMVADQYMEKPIGIKEITEIVEILRKS